MNEASCLVSAAIEKLASEMCQITPAQPTHKRIIPARLRELGTSARSKYNKHVTIAPVAFRTRKHKYGTDYEIIRIFEWFYSP